MLRRSFVASGLIASVLFAAAMTALADPVRYDGHRVVRVQVDNEAQLEALLSISDDMWTEGYGIGAVDVHVSPEQYAVLEKSDLAFSVVIPDLQARIDAHPPGVGGGSPWDHFMQYAEILEYLDTLVALRPDLAETFVMGQTVENRDIVGIRITGPGLGAKPGVLYHGAEHAREWITPPVVMYVADQLIRNYDTDPEIRDLVNRVEWFIVPVFNVDGYMYSWSTDRYWRKNRRNNGNGTWGVDLNRNYDWKWGGRGGCQSWVYTSNAPAARASAISAFTASTTFVRESVSEGPSLPSSLTGLASQFGLGGLGERFGAPGYSLAFYADLVQSREILGALVKSDSSGAHVSLVQLYGIDGESPERIQEAAILKLQSAISVATVRETGVVRLAVKTPWAAVSEQLVRRVLGLVNTFNTETRQSRVAAERRFIEQRLQRMRANLLAAETRFQTFLQQNRDFGNSPHEISQVDLTGKSLVQSTRAGTVGVAAAANASEIYLGSFVVAQATVDAIRSEGAGLVSIIAMGDQGVIRSDEDEHCGIYLRNLLEDRKPDFEAVKTLIMGGATQKFFDPDQPQYHPEDVALALEADRYRFAMKISREDGLLVA
ncbi:MAG: 2-phosphosulfolactate phosphatase, partial [Planctomycetes bacterium]|nr:2-phosphosulfolactate phosphatase [Planctomycetota bacterium]